MKRRGAGRAGVESGRNFGRSTTTLPERRTDSAHPCGTILVDVRVGEDARR
jgi:hypothetical protein